MNFLLLCYVVSTFNWCISEMLPPRSARIMGGKPIRLRARPYMVAIEDQHECICGGTLIAPNCVLTAAHCVSGKANSTLAVILASPQLQQFGYRRRVKFSRIPKGYSASTLDMDIAVLRLYDSNIVNTTEIITIDYDDVKPADELSILGWGETGSWLYDFYSNPRLRGAKVTVSNTDRCRRAYALNDITKNMFCALGGNGQDACEGDSGGPAIRNGNQVGIISFGADCGTDSRKPGVYTRLGSEQVKSFLQKVMAKHCTM